MMRRCYILSSSDYNSYGAKGIRVDEHWHQFLNFVKDMGQPPDGCTLGRLDHDKNYSKDNCEWQSIIVQNRTRRSSTKYKMKENIQLVT